MTAHFGGVRDQHDANTPLEYAVTQLWFTFAGERGVYVFRPQGELFFSDWRFNIFSPDGRRVLLLQDRFGPYHVVEVARLRQYLRGRAEPDFIVSGDTSDGPTSNRVAGVHHDARWKSADTIEFKFTCCGQTSIKEVLLKAIGPPAGASKSRQ